MLTKPDMKKVSLILICLLTAVLCCAATYNVRDYGAKGDGKCLDSKYINIAIAKAEEQGGGGDIARRNVSLWEHSSRQ